MRDPAPSMVVDVTGSGVSNPDLYGVLNDVLVELRKANLQLQLITSNYVQDVDVERE